MGSTVKQKENGFTIVELLIVIVVIGILAAITFVAFNGISARSKTASASAAANGVVKAIEAYNVQVGAYPSTLASLNGPTSVGQPYAIPSSITFLASIPTSAPTSPASITLTKCDASGGATGGLGNQIIYWNYSTNSIAAFTQGSTGSGCTIAQ